MATQELVEGLNALPIFNDVPEKDRNRAIITAGLEMLKPRSELGGGGFLEAAGAGVGAGLAELDTRQDRALAQQSQTFNQGIAERGAAADQQRADSRTVTADANASQAATAASAQAQSAEEFAAQAPDRNAVKELRNAEAEWLRRRHDGTPAGSQTAALESARVTAQMQTLVADNPARYTRPDGTANQALALIDAYKAMGFDELLKNDSLAVILANAEEGQEVQAAVAGLTPTAMGEDERTAAAGPKTITTQAEFDALPPGTVFFNADGVELRK